MVHMYTLSIFHMCIICTYFISLWLCIKYCKPWQYHLSAHKTYSSWWSVLIERYWKLKDIETNKWNMMVFFYMYCHNVFSSTTHKPWWVRLAVLRKMSVYSSENCIMKNSMKNVPRCAENHQWDMNKGKTTLNIKKKVKLSKFNKHYAM
jgi:hypothetical protein